MWTSKSQKQNQPYVVKTYQPATQQYDINQKVEYHFINDFSNRVISDPPVVNVGSGPNPIYWPSFLPQTGLNDGHTAPNVPGSKHIEYFSNQEMVTQRATMLNRGFLDCSAKGFVRDNISAGGQVGGFRITNPSGVTYHFSLPAYSYDEYTFTQKKDNVGGDRFNYLKNPNKYAYTWYLTAVTGPDYVDRNQDGLPSVGDWGYWVSLEYGQWAKEYRWRNPGENFNEELDKNFKSYSKGKKELYYLNRISTNTHTALFIKEIRKDGKGVTSSNENPVTTDIFSI
ncbi:MAG: hypothetical protein IPJ20_19560 [Flammeovirgaceae bacterium]|nr:hypothetical protein [Flammeovirgaceae bacterium]